MSASYLHPIPQELVDLKRRNRMARVDAYPEPIRELIHEYGLTVVQMLLDLGITKPNHITHIVETVLDEFSPSRGSHSKQGVRTEANP
jgi:hypothetical protein